MRSLERQDAILLIAFLALLAFPLQFALRAFDDNTLTSWRWIFAQTSPVRIFLFIMPALGPAFVLSRVRCTERSEPALLFTLACAAVAPLWSEPELILDASRYFLQAAYLEQEGPAAFLRDWGRGFGAWTDLPFVPFLYGMIFRFLGEQRLFIQVLTTLLFAAAVVQSYRIGGRLRDRETGFLAGLLLLAMPYLLTQVPLMLVDVPALFLITLTVNTYLKAIDNAGWARGAFAASAAVCTVLAKYSLWPMLLILPLITLVRAGQGNTSAIRRSAAVLAGTAALAGAAIALHRDVVSAQLAILHSYQWPALGRWKEGFVSTFLFQVHPFIPVLACIGAWRAIRRRDLSFLVSCWFAVFVLVFHVERIRYLLPLFPLLALMAAFGLRDLFAAADVRRFAAYSALAATLVLVYSAYLPFLKATTAANLRDAGAYLDTLPGETVLVRILPQSDSSGNTEVAVPLLDLFTRKRIIYDRRIVKRPDELIIARMPLRFTWEQQLPAYYSGPANTAGTPLVVIADSPAPAGDVLPFSGKNEMTRQKSFAADTGTFRFRTAVTIVQ